MDENFLFWFMGGVVLLICIVVPIAVTQIVQIGNIIGKDGIEEE